MKDLSLHILDIVQNSIAADAININLVINADMHQSLYSLVLRDNGRGMDKKTLRNATDPFFTTRTTRKVGIGIPLLKQNAEHSGGSFSITSSKGRGTEVKAVFRTDHPDCPPEGDLAGVFSLLVTANPKIDFTLEYSSNKGEYTFDTAEVKKELGTIDINEPMIYPIIKEMVSNNLKELQIEFTAV